MIFKTCWTLLLLAVGNAIRVVEFDIEQQANGIVHYRTNFGNRRVNRQLAHVQTDPIILESGAGLEFNLMTVDRIGRQRVAPADFDRTRMEQSSDLRSGELMEAVVVRQEDADAFAASIQNLESFSVSALVGPDGAGPSNADLVVLPAGINVTFYAFQCVGVAPTLDHIITPAYSNTASSLSEKYMVELCWERKFAILKSKQNPEDRLEGEVGVLFLLFPRIELAARTNVLVKVPMVGSDAPRRSRRQLNFGSSGISTPSSGRRLRSSNDAPTSNAGPRAVRRRLDFVTELVQNDPAPAPLTAEEEDAILKEEVEACSLRTTAVGSMPDELDRCSICLEALALPLGQINNPNCRHVFHKACLTGWVRQRWLASGRNMKDFCLKCPLCNRNAANSP